MDRKEQLESAADQVLLLWNSGTLGITSTVFAKVVVDAMSELRRATDRSKFGVQEPAEC